MKKLIENKKAIHDSRGSEFFTKDYESMTSNGNVKIFSNIHPIVRTSPDSQKKTLYVNSTYTREIIGMSKKNSNEILKTLFRHQQRLELTCRFK